MSFILYIPSQPKQIQYKEICNSPPKNVVEHYAMGILALTEIHKDYCSNHFQKGFRFGDGDNNVLV